MASISDWKSVTVHSALVESPYSVCFVLDNSRISYRFGVRKPQSD